MKGGSGAMEKFCPRCGQNVPQLVKGFCLDCYLKQNKVMELPKSIEVPNCKLCGRLEFRGSWFPQTPELFEKIVRAQIKLKEMVYESSSVEILENGHEGIPAKVEVRGTIEGKPVVIRAETLLKSSQRLCNSCMKASSYYHEAIVQVRFEKAPSANELEGIEKEVRGILAPYAEKDGLARIIDIKGDRKGADYLIGSKRAAKRVADKMARNRNGKVTSSNIVTGMDSDGKTKKRFVFCVRV